MKHIRVIIIEDNRLLRDGLTSLLDNEKDISVLASIEGIDAINQQVKICEPDIILLDHGLYDQNTPLSVSELKREFRTGQIILINVQPNNPENLNCIQAGASGFILHDATCKDFLHAIRKVADGNNVLPGKMKQSLFSQIADQSITIRELSEISRLTRREYEIALLIGEGMTNKEIGRKLHLSLYTVKTHVHHILKKLTLQSRVQLDMYRNNNNLSPEIKQIQKKHPE